MPPCLSFDLTQWLIREDNGPMNGSLEKKQRKGKTKMGEGHYI